MTDVVTDMELKVTAKKSPEFYIRAAQQFFTGTNKDPVSSMTITGLGNAIPVAAHVAGVLETEGKAKMTKITTDYPGINQSYGVAQVKIVLETLVNLLPERLQDPSMAKKLAKVKKEGGKRGVEIEGASDMGGLQFFCTNVLEPNGDIDLLVESMRAMNQKCAPDEEERKGGSGAVGKLVISADTGKDVNVVSIVTYIPSDKQEKLTPLVWLQHVCKECGVDENLVEKGPMNMARVEIKKDVEKGVFPLKIKDTALAQGLQHLKNLGLFPDKPDEDSDDDYVYGDDDFGI